MFQGSKVSVLLASAGVGKTTYIQNKLIKEISSGVLPGRVALVTFTTAGVDEIKKRVSDLGYKDSDFNFIRTIHSLTFYLLGLSANNIIGYEQFKRFRAVTGYYINSSKDESEKNYETKLLDIYSMLRIGGKLNEEQKGLMHEMEYNRLVSSYEAFKRANHLYDYTDCLTMYLKDGGIPGLDVAFIDEAQDLTSMQWKVCAKAFSTCRRVYVAGDDFQSIYEYAGASAETLIKLSNDKNNEVVKLEESYRLSNAVYSASRKVVNKIVKKVDKDCRPLRGVKGEVKSIYGLYSVVDDLKKIKYEHNRRRAKNYILFRNNMFTSEMQGALLRNAIPFHNSDGFCISKDDLNLVDRYLNFRKVGFGDALKREKFKEKYSIVDFNDSFCDSLLIPDIEKAVNIQGYLSKYSIEELKEMAYGVPVNLVTTVHRVKGGEADNVYYFLDCTGKVARGYMKDMDSELRVLYVAITRARDNLYFIPSSSKYGLDSLLEYVFG